MFTGIIEAIGEVVENEGSRLIIAKPEQFDDLFIGSSIAVSGVCLSVISFDDESMAFDVVETTKQKTKIGRLQKGDCVNLERALRADGRFEGHIVQGHSEGVGEVMIAPPPLTPPPNAYGIVGGGEQQEEDVRLRGVFGKVYRSIGSLRFPSLSVVEHARGMRKNPTSAEQMLWQAIRGRKVNQLYFRRQRPVGKYILDFYCETLGLGIEVDGGYHDRALKECDAEREQYLRIRGVTIMRFRNEDILMNLDQCLEQISSYVPLHHKSRSDVGEGLGEGATLHIHLPSHLRPFCVPQGSITLDGVSLTIASLQKDSLTVALIPHTLEHTTLGDLCEGDLVNIETDVLGRYVLHREK